MKTRPEELARLVEVLDRHAREGRTLTYLDAAGLAGIDPPHRIHRTARLLERLMKADAEAGRPIRAALVLSRARKGLPAPGFFARARRLGLFGEEPPEAFHRRQVEAVFSAAAAGFCGNRKDPGNGSG